MGREMSLKTPDPPFRGYWGETRVYHSPNLNDEGLECGGDSHVLRRLPGLVLAEPNALKQLQRILLHLLMSLCGQTRGRASLVPKLKTADVGIPRRTSA